MVGGGLVVAGVLVGVGAVGGDEGAGVVAEAEVVGAEAGGAGGVGVGEAVVEAVEGLGGDGAGEGLREAGGGAGLLGRSGLLGVSRTALKAVFQAACLTARCSSSTSLGVLYPRAEWSRF